MQVKNVVTREDEGFTLHIALDEVFAGVKLTSISMFIASSKNDCDGDLAVNWSMDGLQNDESAQTMGTLLLRNIHSKDEVTAVMGQFYWEHAFDERLRAILVANGFSAEAAADVSGSEWGMQDEERASYDAYKIADEVRFEFATEAA